MIYVRSTGQCVRLCAAFWVDLATALLWEARKVAEDRHRH